MAEVIKKLRNVIFNSVCAKIIQRYFVFFFARLSGQSRLRHKGQLIFAQLLRCEALAVENHACTPGALHLYKAKLVRKAGYLSPLSWRNAM